MKRTKLALLCCAGALTLLSACGGSTGGAGTPSPTPTSTVAPTPTPTPAPSPQPVNVQLDYLHVFGIRQFDGTQSSDPLVQASDGMLYGVTLTGGAFNCDLSLPCGVIYRITLDGEQSVFHYFGRNQFDGFNPSAPLIQGTDGALYGTTAYGGQHGSGTIFRITLAGDYQVLHSFGGSDTAGIVPTGRLLQASDGNLYGTTVSGGANNCLVIPQAGGNCGTVYRMTPGGSVTTLYSFGSFADDANQPNGGLIEGADGNLYGTSVSGGANICGSSGGKICGTIFRLTKAGQITILHSFNGLAGSPVSPQGPLVRAADGNFYGTAPSGGENSAGAVFRMTPGGSVTTIHSFGRGFEGGIGPTPYLIQGSDGFLYGSTISGGLNGGSSVGTLYRMSTSGDKSVLFSFGPMFEKPTAPESGVIQASNGAFYGVTRESGQLDIAGGQFGAGTVFRMRLN